eukprot:scaffold127379_cov52-Attheya_sp.AAC.1
MGKVHPLLLKLAAAIVLSSASTNTAFHPVGQSWRQRAPNLAPSGMIHFSTTSSKYGTDSDLARSWKKASATSNKKQSRVLKSVRLFRLSPVEMEYLGGLLINMGVYSIAQSFGFTFDKKLSASTSFLEKLEEVVYKFPVFPRVISLIHSRRRVQVMENVSIAVVKDPVSGKLGVDGNTYTSATAERIAYLVLEDLKNVREGIYPVPSDFKLENLVSRDALMAKLRYAYETAMFTSSDKSYTGAVDYKFPPIKSQYFQELAVGLDLPDYYMYDHHSIAGGFLSPEHIAIYDTTAEVVFYGTYNMARRMLLRPLYNAIQRMGVDHEGGRNLKLLDIGTGTACLLLQIREAFPSLELHGLDLSPAMLDYARKKVQNDPSMKSTKLMQASMEDIPAEECSYEFVTQTNCFHELPESVIRTTSFEISRVLKPGGLFLQVEPVQMIDDPSIAGASCVLFDNKFNEPFILDWMQN